MDVQSSLGRAHGKGGRHALTPVQIAEAVEAVNSAPPKQKRVVMQRLGNRFGCHWRTIQNAVSNSDPAEKPLSSNDKERNPSCQRGAVDQQDAGQAVRDHTRANQLPAEPSAEAPTGQKEAS